MIVAQSDDLFVVDIWISNLIPIPPTTPHLWPPTQFAYVLRVSYPVLYFRLKSNILPTTNMYSLYWSILYFASIKNTIWAVFVEIGLLGTLSLWSIRNKCECWFIPLAGFAIKNTQFPNSWKVKFNNSDQRYKGIAFNWVSDVTLVHEDDEKLEAHKVILAASSPFLQSQVHSWDIPGIYFEIHPDSMPAGGYKRPEVDTGA